MGTAKASELLLFNKKISAAEAFNRNLVTEVIPDSMFQKETQAKVEAYAKFPPQVSSACVILLVDGDSDQSISTLQKQKLFAFKIINI